MFNATFSNISVISWRSVLLVEETGVLGENNPTVASHWQTLSHNVVSSKFRDTVITPTLNIPTVITPTLNTPTVITPTIITPTLNTSTVTDSLCNSGAFNNPNAVRDCPFKGAWFLSRSRKFFSYAALLFLKLFSAAQQNIFYKTWKENIISCRSNKNAFCD